jgi:hypothetical protein
MSDKRKKTYRAYNLKRKPDCIQAPECEDWSKEWVDYFKVKCTELGVSKSEVEKEGFAEDASLRESAYPMDNTSLNTSMNNSFLPSSGKFRLKVGEKCLSS